MQISIIVPTFRESANVRDLVRRLSDALEGHEAEIVFVDDSDDETPETIRRVAKTARVPVRLLHRDDPQGGLGGAVVAGFAVAEHDVCLVMDGDLQHPPESVPRLIERFEVGDVDIVIASRYLEDGTSHGLANRTRVLVSRASTLVTKAMFPLRLRDTTDPMTGFFLVDRRAIDAESLRPRGFKILLEILARKSLNVGEVPFHFGDRFAGDSKASFRQGVHFIAQLGALRFGKLSLFAVIGGVGALANVFIVWLLTALGVGYIIAAVIAAELTIIVNFLLIERFVFGDMRGQASGVWARFGKSFAFNNVEAAIRIPLVALLVSTAHLSAALATAVTLVIAFFVRFVFHALVVYAPREDQPMSPTRRAMRALDEQSLLPGEL